MNKLFLWGISAGLLLIVSTAALAAKPMHSQHPESSGFQAIDQPLPLKILVALAGMGLIGLELNWFLRKPKLSQKAQIGSVQQITVEVNGGYQPNHLILQAQQPTVIHFHRTDPSPCLEKVMFPEFGIAADLPLGGTVPIAFTPNIPGKFEFVCGMNMVRGTIEVQT